MNLRKYQLSQQLGLLLKAKRLTVTTAESCTGGGIAQAITEIAGSSEWFNCSFVTYSNESKARMLDIDIASINGEGAVSEFTVRAMSKSACVKAEADISVAVSGIAGPSGGSKDKPVGTVWLAWATQSGCIESKCFCFDGDRASVREQAICMALEGLLRNAGLR